MKKVITVIVLLGCTALPVTAQRGLKNIPDPDVKKQLASFKVAEGFQINLFAADPMFAKPIQMNWDAAGRLWIASSSIYPQIKPGQKANDQIVVLEDADGDGKAEKRTVFADGLLIPTAVIPYKTGAFVANSTELLFLDDTDGDGKADKRTVVLSGFGSEDTHHILHTFRWGPDGNLYMNQSIYIHSHIETPYGPRRLGAGGIWQFNPRTLRLEVMSRGLINSWGHHFDRWGQSFATDGAGGQGINYMFPDSVHRTAKFAKKTIPGLNPGQPKIAGLEVISGRHIPEAYRGNLIGHDFRGHRTARFILSEDGSGYASRRSNDLVSTPHAAFRPIDVKMGPDGAIYIADWYNPIIQHGEVDFRDKRRDHTHGRVWRITAKGRSLVEKPKLVGASVEQLLEHLKAPEQWTREQAKRVLAESDKTQVVSATKKWAQSLDPKDPDHAHHMLEAVWVLQSHDTYDLNLITAKPILDEPRALAAVVRVTRRWLLDHPEATQAEGFGPWVETGIAHKHPRVRLETVHLLRQLGTPDAVRTALRALDQPVDRFIEFSLQQTAQASEAVWSKVLADGKQPFANASHLLFAMKATGSKNAGAALAKLMVSPQLKPEDRISILALMAETGGPKELDRVLAEALKASEVDRQLLIDAMGRSRHRPAKADAIERLFQSKSTSIRHAAMRLGGRWRTSGALKAFGALVDSAEASPSEKAVAIEAIGLMRSGDAKKKLNDVIADAKANRSLRMAAMTALASIDFRAAVEPMKKHLPELGGADPSALVQAFLAARGGNQSLESAIKNMKLPPDIAATAVRVVGSSGRKMPGMVNAFIKAGGLQPLPTKLTAGQIAKLIDDVAKNGNAARGEKVYRKAQIACMACHAIGGAGGVVGPDLISIGASAPVDYLIESLFEPNKKIKEGYHLTTVQTKDGKVYTGMVVRKTAEQTVVRDATGKETAVASGNIQKSTITPTSLMPPGLTASLRRDEVVDLVRFLSELGKEGDYKVSAKRYVRRFKANADGGQAGHARSRKGIAAFAQDPDVVDWIPAYTHVSGKLDVTPFHHFRWVEKKFTALQFEIEVTTPGDVGLVFSRTEGLQLWTDGVATALKPTTRVKLASGRHRMTLVVQRLETPVPFSIEVVDLPGSPAKAQPVGGP